MSQTTKAICFLNRESLKLLAMFFMLLDHAYMTVVTGNNFQWMTQVGRLAFPIFAFQIVEGFLHTSNRKRYIGTMLLFALLSEIPYNLMMGGEILGPFHQNVMFTFLIALLLLQQLDRIWHSSAPMARRALLAVGICMLGVVLGTVTFVDYLGFGVLTVLLLYLAKQMPNAWTRAAVQLGGLWAVNWVFLGGRLLTLPNGWEIPEQAIALLSLPLIWCYNGRKTLTGKAAKAFQYASYLFYPAHMLVLSLVALWT